MLVNGIEKEKGFLSGNVSRSEAEYFDIVVDLSAGDTVELELFEDPAAAAGFFVGVKDMTITVAVPIYSCESYPLRRRSIRATCLPMPSRSGTSVRTMLIRKC